MCFLLPYVTEKILAHSCVFLRKLLAFLRELLAFLRVLAGHFLGITPSFINFINLLTKRHTRKPTIQTRKIKKT